MKTERIAALAVLLLVGVLVYMASYSYFAYGQFAQGPNNRNVSVDVKVNITNSLPTVLGVIISGNGTTGTRNITLNAGSWQNITCNATIRDYNGWDTIRNVSGTLYHNVSSNSGAADDNNTHYSNTNCTLGEESIGGNSYTTWASCSFLVQYYTNVGGWNCNVTATDGFDFQNVSRSQSGQNVTFINPLLALNVTPLIDYGDLAVGDTSAPQQANITNFGNQNINVSVRGYGRNLTDNLAVVCEVGNITIDNEKYNLIGGADLTQYTNLTNAARQIPGLTVFQQTNDSQQVVNTSYWVLYVPPNPFGQCNGTIVFQAELS